MRKNSFRMVVGGVVLAVVSGSTVLSGGAVAAPSPLERFEHQNVQWHGCADERLNAGGAQCAELTVPLDYGRPQGRTITVAISRLAATDPAARRGVMLTNPGGPGVEGLTYPLDVLVSAKVRAAYDIIGMDPRGVGRSTGIDCGWPAERVPGGDRRPAGDHVGFYADVAVAADLAARCVAAAGDLLPYINTRNTARDMAVIGAALGESKISYVTGSYGTYLGAVFTQLFPERADRIVLDSSVDPERYWLDMFRDGAATNEAALDQWAQWTADRDAEFHLGTDGRQVRAVVEDLLNRTTTAPIMVGDLSVDDDVVLVIVNILLSFAASNPVLAQVIGELTAAENGVVVVVPSSPAWPEIRNYVGLSDTFPWHFAVKCGDVAAPRDPEWYWRNVEQSRAEYPVFGPLFNSITPCSFWPAPVEAPTVIRNAVPVLLLQASGDIRTPYAGGLTMHRVLSGSRLITMEGMRAHGTMGFGFDCLDTRVETYLVDGTLPESDITCSLR